MFYCGLVVWVVCDVFALSVCLLCVVAALNLHVSIWGLLGFVGCSEIGCLNIERQRAVPVAGSEVVSIADMIDFKTKMCSLVV